MGTWLLVCAGQGCLLPERTERESASDAHHGQQHVLSFCGTTLSPSLALDTPTQSLTVAVASAGGVCLLLLSPCCAPSCTTQVFRTRQQLFKAITPDYYGFRDEEDGVLLTVEADAQAEMQAKVSTVIGGGRVMCGQ